MGIDFNIDDIPEKKGTDSVYFDMSSIKDKVDPQVTPPTEIQPVNNEESIGRKVINGLAYVGRVLSGQEYDKTRNELSQKVQNDINALPDGTQKQTAQLLHDTSNNMETILNDPVTSVTQGLDAAKEQALKQKAIDLIAKADSLDESSLYSSQIKQLMGAIGDKVPTQEEAQKLQELQKARIQGYDKLFEKAGIGELGIDQKTGEKYLIIGDKQIALDDSLIDEIQGGLKANAGVAVGAMSGAMQGAKYGTTPLTKTVSTLAGGAMGAFGGSLADTALNASATDKEIDAKLALRKASEEAIADPLMTLLTAGTIHVAGKPFVLAADKAKDLTTVLKHYVVDSNLDGASKVLKEQGYDQATIDAINAGISKFQNAPQEIKAPRDNIITQTLGKIDDGFQKYVKSGTAEAQNSFLNVAQQDGTLINQLEEVLLKNPSLAKPVSKDINERSVSVEKALSDRSINPWEVRGKIETYEQGVKAEYAQTKELIQEAIPEARFNLKSTGIQESLDELEKSVGDTNIKNELTALSYRIGKNEDLNASQFIDVREDINRILGKSSVQSYGDKKALSQIKETLDESLNVALKDAPIDHQAIKTQFENAVAKYRSMKELQDTNLYAGIMGDELSIDNVTAALSRGAHTGDGTLDTMLSKLSKSDREKVEYSVIENLYKKNQKAFGDQKATDFVELSKELDNLALKNFKSEAARKTISDLKEMSNYFKNDTRMLDATTKSKAPTFSQGISNNPLVRLRTRLANYAANFVLTYSPFSAEYAFRHHLKQALKRSRSPIEFMTNITKYEDAPTSLLQNLQSALKEYQKEAYKNVQTPKEIKEATQVQKTIDTMQKRLDKIIIDERKPVGKNITPNWKYGDAEYPIVKSDKAPLQDTKTSKYTATFIQPSSEELKVVDQLADLDTKKAIIAIKEGKATDYQKVKYLNAKEAIGQERIDQEVLKIQENVAALKEKEQALLLNPRLEELLKMRENVTANDVKYAQRQIGSSGITENGDFYKSTNTINHAADFELLGSDVKRIREGRLNENIITKLENDLGRLENDPLYKDLPVVIQNQIFSRGALSAAGALNGVTIEDDGTISFNSIDALKGMAIGAGLELFGSRLLKGDSMMRRGSIGIVPDKRSVELYAKAGSVIAEKMPQKMETTALEAMLKKAGVKDEEISWSGIKALKGKVSKEEVEAILDANRLELNEIIKTDPQTQRYLAYTEAGGTNYKEYLLTLPNLPSFQSKHWDENNIVAFMRTKDRAIDNKKSLFIEEIQSDWHQEGRKKGYEGNIPEAPFKTSWPELAVKRLIKEAIDNGYEQIAWTTGASQAKRYSLTKSLKEIDYKINSDGTYTLDITHKDGARDKRAYVQPIDLQDHIGKDLSERVLKNEGNGILNSSNLQIENKGMNTFYDTIIPTAVKKWLKVQPQKVKVGDQEVWSATIKQNRAEEIQKSGLPLYSTIGGTFSIGVGGNDGAQ